jgi:MoxR-like ATPase
MRDESKSKTGDGGGAASDGARRIAAAVETALLGQRRAIELAVCTFVAGGHLLIEDVPGVGKTTLARALAKASGGEFRRIQFTSDMLPADITGVAVWSPAASEFQFKPGPVFGNVVLADEINRAPAKTQSALLEAMSERQVSVDGVPRPLPAPFMVIATENAEEHYGTYPLPESQLDRFMMRISLGYPDARAERSVVARPTLADPVDRISQAISASSFADVAAAVDATRVDDSLLDYVMEIVASTRRSRLLSLGVSPRGGMALHRAARARAVLEGRSYCLADDVKALAESVLAHRVIPASGAGGGRDGRQAAVLAIREIIESVEIPL